MVRYKYVYRYTPTNTYGILLVSRVSFAVRGNDRNVQLKRIRLLSDVDDFGQYFSADQHEW